MVPRNDVTVPLGSVDASTGHDRRRRARTARRQGAPGRTWRESERRQTDVNLKWRLHMTIGLQTDRHV